MKRAGQLPIPAGLDDLADPARTAVLVYDMQVGIRSQVAVGDAIVERCQIVLAAARATGMRIVYTRHLSSPATWMGTTQYRTAMAWQRIDDPAMVKPWFLRDTPAAAIVPELAPKDDDLVLDKLAMSAFEGTPLAYALRDCGITGVAICGIAMEIGIEPTARHATDLGFVPIIIEDACGYGDATAAARSIETLRFVGEAVMTDVKSFVTLLRR